MLHLILIQVSIENCSENGLGLVVCNFNTKRQIKESDEKVLGFWIRFKIYCSINGGTRKGITYRLKKNG